MKTIEISGTVRTEFGKKSAKQIRKTGNVPCIIYSKEGNINFYAEEKSLNNLIYTADAHFVKLDLEGKTYMLILQDTQFHPVTDKLIHADFIQIANDKPIVMNVPVHVYGDCAAVKAGGKLIVKKRSLKVKALADDMPEFISIDISDLKMNHSIRVLDLAFDKFTLTDHNYLPIVTVASSRAVKSDETESTESGAAETAPAAETETKKE